MRVRDLKAEHDCHMLEVKAMIQKQAERQQNDMTTLILMMNNIDKKLTENNRKGDHV
jgi:hypothetical protein